MLFVWHYFEVSDPSIQPTYLPKVTRLKYLERSNSGWGRWKVSFSHFSLLLFLKQVIRSGWKWNNIDWDQVRSTKNWARSGSSEVFEITRTWPASIRLKLFWPDSIWSIKSAITINDERRQAEGLDSNIIWWQVRKEFLVSFLLVEFKIKLSFKLDLDLNVATVMPLMHFYSFFCSFPFKWVFTLP